VHDARDDPCAPLSWDPGFLACGVPWVVGEWLLHRRGVRTAEEAVRDARKPLIGLCPAGRL
jgi:hypothetical protein